MSDILKSFLPFLQGIHLLRKTFKNVLCNPMMHIKTNIFWHLSLHTLTWQCVFSRLFSIHYLWCLQREFLQLSIGSVCILQTVLYTFLVVLTTRISSAINRFSGWWSFTLLSWPWHLIQQWSCSKKLDTNHS